MTDIKKSLLAGLQSAKEAHNNIREINLIIKETSNEVEAVSNGKALFGIGDFVEVSENTGPLAASLAMMAAAYGQEKRRRYKGLAIFNSEGKAGTEIAEWTQHENGYPCSIKYNDFTLYCNDKEELENAIAELLKETKTGKAILSKMNS